jgi:iron complex transport system substrate-binding protein
MKKLRLLIAIIMIWGSSAFSTQAAPAASVRIISLSPAVTSELFDLGVQDKLVGVTRYCMNPGGKKEIVGNLTDINLEKIILLKPDLIVAGKDANRKKDIEKLVSMGFRVEIFEGCEIFECMCTEFIRLGKLTGSQLEAERIVDKCRKELSSISARAGSRHYKVLWQIGANPMIVAGGPTFASELIRLSGCINIFGDVKTKYPRVNMEEVLVRNPDVIIIISGMGAGADIWKRMKGISAVSEGRIFTVKADAVCQATPVRFVEGLKIISSILAGKSR